MSNYGIPYMGSKNKIAHIIIDVLPPADNFYDLFCGGCSVTHCAILSKKFKNIIFNDIEKGLPQLFLDAVHGKYKKENRWISREDFFKLKDNDLYVRYLWSFGNNGVDYLYSKKIEPYKKAYWYAVMFDDFSLLQKLEINIPRVRANTYKEKRLKIRQSLQSLESLERLQSLESYNLSYEQVEIKENSIIYCDIPYENTKEYVAGSFDHKKFYDWAYNQKEIVVISSYCVSDERFQMVFCLKKRQTLNGKGSGKQVNEGLFVAKNKIELWREMRKKSKCK